MNETPPPLPDHPVPPTAVSDEFRSRQNWRSFWIVVAVLMALAGGMAMLTIPLVIQVNKKANRALAISNAKQIGMALFDFEQDYDKYPDASTMKSVSRKTGTRLHLGSHSSNDYFRQLIAAGYITDEKAFYAPIKGSHEPDKLMDGAQAIAKGECGFAYIIGPDSGHHPRQPLLVTPLIPGTLRFDPKPFDGRAVIYWTDCSAMAEPIDKNGHVCDNAGINLLDPANPVWNGKPPVIVYPQMD